MDDTEQLKKQLFEIVWQWFKDERFYSNWRTLDQKEEWTAKDFTLVTPETSAGSLAMGVGFLVNTLIKAATHPVDAQKELTDFVTDPKTISKAVEGSMEKRASVLYAVDGELADLFNAWYEEEVNNIDEYDEPKDALHATFARIAAHLQAAVQTSEEITFGSVACRWNEREQHVRHVIAIQNGKIVNDWPITDDEVKSLFGEGPYGICQEQVVAFGLQQLKKGTV